MNDGFNEKFDVVCPLAEKDVGFYCNGIELKWKYLPVKEFVVIGNDKVGSLIKGNNDGRIRFVNENQFVSYDKVREIIGRISDQNRHCMNRTGWYLQQFLKFSYSLICEDEYYLLWDADTIPIHNHEMIVDERPIFDMKTEHNEPYFETFSKMFPKYERRNSLSYISEHMLVKTQIMRELIDEIEDINLIGDTWYEKIIGAIDLKDLPKSGFSDYDTYGLYCLNRYPDLYSERRWDSLRPASAYFMFDNMRECDYEWLIKDYDAVSFEAGWRLKRFINVICTNRWIQSHISCKTLLRKVLHQFTI